LPLSGADSADLVVVGGGFTGLWAAIEAKLESPNQRIVLLDADRIAGGATGRNGGFISSSLTHGFGNGLSRWPDEILELERLGIKNLNEISNRISEFGISCDFVREGEIAVAVAKYQYDELVGVHKQKRALGLDSILMDRHTIRDSIKSPLFEGGLVDPHSALVNPAELAWGLARAGVARGVSIYENSKVVALQDCVNHVRVSTSGGHIDSKKVILATNAYPPLLKYLRNYVVPVYDYVLVTEPLSRDQRDSVGWRNRQGLADAGNQFHYYRLTADNRVLFGGFDAKYHRGNGMGPEFDVDENSFALLADHFAQTFPQLAGVQFTHGWGGAIDTCSRFSAFWGTSHGGKTAYVLGYTGLGVGAARFGALTCLDLLARRHNERTRLQMVATRPLPFPPEPLRSIGIDWTTRALQQADRNKGKRNLWLKTLDTFGMGFDS
jgi:glycine/D-amino acid oxidase-like deaminating enzyme